MLAALSEFEVWMFLAGLGIFLFGMHMMEESIRVLSGAAFKSLIRRYTGTRLKAMGSGMVSTAILQSSSAVSLMTLAFVGAGIMNLIQAISVMIGAKVGTTATAWIVAIFGFEFNIETFSLPLIGLGGLGIIILAKSPKYVNISRFLVAFGFLFMGLDYMKSSVDDFAAVIDPELFAGYGILTFALAGVILTAVMQSSSATIAIVLTMLFSGVVTFEAGAAMVIGANVGTTVTVLLGSIGGIHTKKQAALSQLSFTVGTAIIALILLPFLVWVVLSAMSFDENLVLGLAMFHTIFNLFGAMLFYPIIPWLAGRAETLIPEKRLHLTRYIHKTSPEVSDAAIEAFRKEVACQLGYTVRYISGLIHPSRNKGEAVLYSDLERYHAEIFEYYTRIISSELNEREASVLERLLRVSRSLMNTLKNMNESTDEFSVMERETHQIFQTAWLSVKKRLDMVAVLAEKVAEGTGDNAGAEFTGRLEQLHEEIEAMDKEYIRMCSKGVNDPSFHKPEVTFLLMVNRIVTQSCRMMIFGMRTLIEAEDDTPNPVE
ncbi:MAG: Na/Pi cotransporter family protein [Balneolaceae bacterium]|nr:Na/Pi cotransporter family protein [Balneolaceae bacterium]MCH8547477.1 Na/Pi symporter [Balneolaceae bacterium]